MDVEFSSLAEYIRKAAMYDAIISYVKHHKYLDKDDVLAFTGENITEDEEDNDNA